jgi:predicted O-methyltransferase YrrM
VTDYPNWFQGVAKDNFEQHLEHFKGQNNLHFLQVGAFTGDASKWLLDNILTGTGCMLTDVDTWAGSDEGAHHQMNFSDVEKTYDAKLSVYSTAFKHKMTSDEYFADHSNGWYDFVYVDADHTAAAAYKDGVNGWRDLKPNGILAFDDYTWGDGLPDQTLAPRPGIDKFLDEFNGQYHLMHKGAQVWIRKNEIVADY